MGDDCSEDIFSSSFRDSYFNDSGFGNSRRFSKSIDLNDFNEIISAHNPVLEHMETKNGNKFDNFIGKIIKIKSNSSNYSEKIPMFNLQDESKMKIASSSFLKSEEHSSYSSENINSNQICNFMKILLMSCIYAVLSFGVASFVMVLAHERLPEISKYPPLPDIVLDNLPYMEWAFEAAETCGVILSLILIVVLTFHSHRFIVIRRLCSLMGTVFLLRSVTMIITSLSVPGKHLADECSPFLHASTWNRMGRALEIWLGFGMTLRGVKTCGDYMFSGHASCFTLLNFFINEYTPRSWLALHGFCWTLTISGIFFILAAHEHYSIDVFIAVYISSRLFLYYHTLANNRRFMINDEKRAKIWFPLFSFFEKNVNGVVPNIYKSPFSYSSLSAFMNENCNENFTCKKKER